MFFKKYIFAYPGTTPNFFWELIYFVQNFPNIWNNVLAITVNNSISRSSQGNVKNRTILGAIDLKSYLLKKVFHISLNFKIKKK